MTWIQAAPYVLLFAVALGSFLGGVFVGIWSQARAFDPPADWRATGVI